ncbi:MAG: ROK family protein [Rhodothermales bacterium]
MQHFAIGIDLGGTNIKAALVERTEGLVYVTRKPTEAEQGAEHVLDRIVSIVRIVMAKTAGKPVDGIGIGVPGTVNLDRTSLSHPPNIPGWEQINLRNVLQERLDVSLPVIVENDANVAGLGSSNYGTGRPYDSFIMVTLGTGVGGAVIYQNKIFRGSTGGAAEIGHMTIDYEGPKDNADVAGSIEAYLGQRFLCWHARKILQSYPESRVYRMAGRDLAELTPETLSRAAEKGDKGARDVLAWAGHKLGCVLGSVVNLLDIRTIIVGGGISAAGDYILEPARKSIRHFLHPGLREDVTILQETLGNEAGILGAAYLVFEFLDTHDTPPERS